MSDQCFLLLIHLISKVQPISTFFKVLSSSASPFDIVWCQKIHFPAPFSHTPLCLKSTTERKIDKNTNYSCFIKPRGNEKKWSAECVVLTRHHDAEPGERDLGPNRVCCQWQMFCHLRKDCWRSSPSQGFLRSIVNAKFNFSPYFLRALGEFSIANERDV